MHWVFCSWRLGFLLLGVEFSFLVFMFQATSVCVCWFQDLICRCQGLILPGFDMSLLLSGFEFASVGLWVCFCQGLNLPVPGFNFAYARVWVCRCQEFQFAVVTVSVSYCQGLGLLLLGFEYSAAELQLTSASGCWVLLAIISLNLVLL